MVRRLGTFKAASEDGRTFFVHHYQEFIDGSTPSGVDSIPGMECYELNDGTNLNFIDEDTFELVGEGIMLKRLR